MIQEKLNFDILNNIQTELEGHARKLTVFSDLLCNTDDTLFNKEGLGYDLGSFIQDWLDEQALVVEKAVERVRNHPDYIMQRAKELVAMTENRKGMTLPTDFHKITEKLEEAIRTFGKAYFPEAKGFLGLLKAIASESENKEGQK